MTYLFPELGSLHAALLAREVPDEVASAPCSWGRRGKAVWVHTDARLDVGEPIERPGPGTPASCWPEVLPVARGPLPDDLNEVVFVVPSTELLALAGELLRLGCDRQKWSVHGESAFLRASAPPWYTVLAHAERGSVYRAVRPGVWAALDVRHPFLEGLQIDGDPVLVPSTGPWLRMPDGPWTELYQALQVHLDGDATAHEATQVPRLEVHLRLVPGSHQDAPVFWVLRDRPVEQLEALLSRVPQKTLQPLRFAATDGDEPLILLRAPNTRAVADLGLRAEAFAPLLSLPNAFRPVHTTLEPPLRQDAIRDLLGAQSYEVAWVTATADGIDVHRIHQSAFRPLTEWVEYVVSRSTAALAPWVEQATFAFEEWTDIGREWTEAAAAPSPRERAPSKARKRRSVRTSTASAPARAVQPLPVVQVENDSERDALVAKLGELEARFRSLDSGPDAPERTMIWTEMAMLLRRLGRQREARLAWAQAHWHSREPGVARAWAGQELAEAGRSADELPVDPSHTWALATSLLAGALEPTPELSTHFDAHDADLDARTAWSVRERLAEGDALALERARDVLLARLRTGLVRGVDVPGFLGRVDAGTREQLQAHLVAQHEHFRKTKRDRSVLEAPVELTSAYVDLVFAWGFATLGSRDHVERLRAVSLDRQDPIHDALVGAYQARIDQALQGRPREAPLPEAAARRFRDLKGLQKYKVDRLRSASAILEPRERLDPFRAYTLEGTERPHDLHRLSGDALVTALGERLDGEPDAETLHQVLLALPGLAVTTASDLLGRVSVEHLPPEERLQLHTDALVAAGLIGQRTLAQRHATGVQQALDEVTSEQLAEATRSLVQAFRGLRRLGLQDLAVSALDRVLAVADGRRFVDQLTRTAAAGGLALHGEIERAVPLLDSALAIATQPFERPVDQQRMTRTLALALSAAPRDIALERLPTLAAALAGISDSFNTNSHFCFSVVDFAESIVLGYSDRQLLQDPKARAFLLDDEFLLRSRLG